MKWLCLSISIFYALSSFGQNTFSGIYDIDEDGIRNYMKGIVIMNNNIISYSSNFCLHSDSSYRSCVGLTKFTMSGELIDKIIIDTLDSFVCCEEGFASDGERLYMSSYVWGESDKLSVIQLDNYLNQLNINKYTEDHTLSRLINSGVKHINGSLYVYGRINNSWQIPDSVSIIKTDLSGNELERFYYSYGNSNLRINSFQASPDGNFVFILSIVPPPGANTGFDGYQLMKVDTSGTVLDSFILYESFTQPNRILATSNGGYVFGSEHHPFDGADPFTTGYGLINKLDANMDTLEWSLVLPNNQLLDGRHYVMNDYIEVSNGDIIACGRAYDSSDTELAPGVSDKNSTWNGFIVRLTPFGVIKWLRLYKYPNDLLSQAEYGKFRPSILQSIKELPDGRLFAAGQVYVTSTQLFNINEYETEAFHLWLLIIDEDGCLDGYPCEEINYITSTDELPILNNKDIHLFPNPVIDILKFTKEDLELNNYQIFNLLGQITKQGKFDSEIDVSDLPGNTYFIRLYDDRLNSKIIKFIKL
jgi:hypothetical protein